MLTALVLSAAILATPASTPALHVEARAASSATAQDRMGIAPSIYRGLWYTPKLEQARRCILKRESHGNYRARNPETAVSTASGAYQFLDRQWRDSLVWMFLSESKKTNDTLEDEAKALRSKPIAKWSRYWQDRAFYTAARHGKGLHHWYHPGIRCF